MTATLPEPKSAIDAHGVSDSAGLMQSLMRRGVPEEYASGDYWGLKIDRNVAFAWYPILDESSRVRFEILELRGRGLSSSRPPAADLIVFPWMQAQLAIARQSTHEDLRRFVRAYDSLNTLLKAESWSQFVRGMLCFLCSGRGLGWNRAWLLEKWADEGDTVSYVPVAAVGQLNKEKWLQACNRSQNMGFNEQLLHAMRASDDQADDLAVLAGALRGPIEFPAAEVRELLPSDPKAIYAIPVLRKAPYLVSEKMNDWVRTNLGAERGSEFEEDAEHYASIWLPHGSDYLVLLSGVYTGLQANSVYMTTLLLEHLAGVASNLEFVP